MTKCITIWRWMHAMLDKMQQKAGGDNSQPLGSVNIMSVWEKDPERSSLSGGKDSEGKFLI